jgi:OmpR family response regulator RpaB
MGVHNERILIAEEDISIRNVLHRRLSLLGYKVALASNGNEALRLLKTERPHLVILSLLLPGFDGYEVCFKIKQCSNAQIIILSGLTNIPNLAKILELGADDYLTKPFSLKELEVRIKSALKRSYPEQIYIQRPKEDTNITQIGELSIDWSQRVVFKNQTQLKLTGLEFSLLELLFEYAGKTLSRTTILNNIWGYTPERGVDMRMVDVHISRLRSKLEDNSRKPNFILTVRGQGYLFRQY